MVYRSWTIKAYSTSLGYLARYTSPMGQACDAGGLFATEEIALAYAQAVVDHLMRCERLGLSAAKGPAPEPGLIEPAGLSGLQAVPA